MRSICHVGLTALALAVLYLPRAAPANAEAADPKIGAELFAGLREFYAKTSRPDGSFSPGVDPDYRGMSDCAYSDLAAVTYASTVHKTFGWELPRATQTIEFLQARQREDGSFFNVAGTVDPDSPEGRTYNTTQGLVALHALGAQPKYNPLPVFEEILRQDYKELPPYSTSFFPLAYLCYGEPIPEKADRGIRALMIQDSTGYTGDHIAATYHASHYYRLVGEETPKSAEMVERILREQKADGSWLLNMPSRDRHATFDAVFTLRHEGRGRADCLAAIERAARWSLTCRNDDGGFGHYPGSTSDADAVYFHVGTLVMAGFLKAADPLPNDPHLLSWGHLMPLRDEPPKALQLSLKLPAWVGAVAFSPDGQRLAVGTADGVARVFDAESGEQKWEFKGHADYVTAVAFSPDGGLVAIGSYDHTARLWDAESGEVRSTLAGHRGAVLGVAFSPDGATLATASIDGDVKLWSTSTGDLVRTLSGHKSWVNSVTFAPDGRWLASGSSDGTIRIWSHPAGEPLHTIDADPAEIRSIAISPDAAYLAAGIRYGKVKLWRTADWSLHRAEKVHEGDVWAVAFAPHSRVLASGGGDWNRPGLVKLWNVESGVQIASAQHTGEVLSIAFSPVGKQIAAGAADKTVKVWDVGELVAWVQKAIP